MVKRVAASKTTVRDRLKSLREVAKWTQDQLATQLGVNRAYVSMLESGRRRHPRGPFLMRLADLEKARGIRAVSAP